MVDLDLLLSFKSMLASRNIYFFLLAVGVILVVITLFGISVQYKKINAVEVKPKNSAQNQIQKDLESIEPENIFVDIGGAVKNPGIYRLKTGARIADLIQASGGVLSNTAAAPWFLKNINTAKSLADEQKVYIPFDWEVYESTQSIADLSDFPILTNSSGEKQSLELVEKKEDDIKETAQSIAPSTQNKIDSSQKIESTAGSSKINVNSATSKELEELEGIGAVYATRIVQNRPYSSLEELKTKAKLSDSVISKIKDDIVF